MDNLNMNIRSIIISTCALWNKDIKKDFLNFIESEKKDLEKLLLEEENPDKVKYYIEKFGEYEYNLNYSYNFFFESSSFDETVELLNESYYKNRFNDNSIIFLSYRLENPILKLEETSIKIKFSKILKDATGKKIILPVIIKFYLEEKIIQIKIRRLPCDFHLANESQIFLDILEETKIWMNNNLNMVLKHYDIFKYALIVFKNRFFENEGLERIILNSFSTKSKQYGVIKLKKDTDNLLPVLNELQNIQAQFVNETDKNILGAYIRSIIEKTTFYKINLTYQFGEKQLKKDQINIELTSQYTFLEETLIFFSANTLSEKERDDVIKFIIKYGKENNTIRELSTQ